MKVKTKFKPTVRMQTRANCKALIGALNKHPASVLLSEDFVENPDVDLTLQELKQVIVGQDSKIPDKLNSLVTLKVVVDKLFTQSKTSLRKMHTQSQAILERHKRLFVQRQT